MKHPEKHRTTSYYFYMFKQLPRDPTQMIIDSVTSGKPEIWDNLRPMQSARSGFTGIS